MNQVDPFLTAVQYGWPGVFALILWWLGKMANKFLDAHLENMKKIVDRLDDHARSLDEHTNKLDSLLSRARDTKP